jgi:hypothetical protein
MRLLALVALALTPSQASFFHRPSVHGNSYSYSGDGEAPDEPLFEPGDAFTDVCVAGRLRFDGVFAGSDFLAAVQDAGELGSEWCSSSHQLATLNPKTVRRQ